MENESTTDETDEQQDQGNPTFYAEGLTVITTGQVTLPARHREMYDIGYRDVVTLVVWPQPDGEGFLAPDIIVDGSGRVRIPRRQRRLYGIQDGDKIDINVEVTGQHLPTEDDE